MLFAIAFDGARASTASGLPPQAFTRYALMHLRGRGQQNQRHAAPIAVRVPPRGRLKRLVHQVRANRKPKVPRRTPKVSCFTRDCGAGDLG